MRRRGRQEAMAARFSLGRRIACARRLISRFRRGAPAAASSLLTSTAFAPIAGSRSNSSATAAATAADSRWRRPSRRAAARCLARPPRIARMRAAVAYDDLSRSLAIHLKYGRKVAVARTMAHYMAPLVKPDGEAILVPVPLHRTRLWTRGFNQSALVASELSRRLEDRRRSAASAPDAPHSAAQGHELAPAAQDCCRRLSDRRQGGDRGKDRHPGR